MTSRSPVFAQRIPRKTTRQGTARGSTEVDVLRQQSEPAAHYRGIGNARTLSLAEIAQLQHTIGNQAVQRLLKTGPGSVIQPYRVISSTDYSRRHKAVTKEKTAFPYQKLEKTDYRAEDQQYPGEGRKPDLKVSNHGEMAVEHSSDSEIEPRVFFATDQVLASSNKTLSDMGSEIGLQPTSPGIQVPSDPSTPATSAKRKLRAVQPTFQRNGPDAMGKLILAGDECSIVAKLIMGLNASDTGNVPVFQNPTQGRHEPGVTASYYTSGDQGSDADLRQVAAFATKTGGGAKELSEAMTDTRSWTGQAVVDSKDADLDAAFKAGRIDPKAMSILEHPTTSSAVKTKVKELLASGQNVKVDAATVQKVIVKTYGSLDTNTQKQRSKALGINQYAVPDVGEAMGTFTLDEGRAGDPSAPLKSAVDRLEEQVNDFTWSWHFAGVVAKETSGGDDRVTLENYNRRTVNTGELRRTFLKLIKDFREFEQFVKTRNEFNTNPLNATNYHKIIEDRKKQIDKDSDEAKALAQWGTKPGTGPGQWFFKMYGSAEQDVGGATEDQSFHAAMTRSGDFKNPLTVRFNAPLAAYQDFVKNALNHEKDQCIQTATRVITDARTLAGIKKEVEDRTSDWIDRIGKAATKAEVAAVYHEALHAFPARDDRLDAATLAVANAVNDLKPIADLSEFNTFSRATASAEAVKAVEGRAATAESTAATIVDSLKAPLDAYLKAFAATSPARQTTMAELQKSLAITNKGSAQEILVALGKAAAFLMGIMSGNAPSKPEDVIPRIDQYIKSIKPILRLTQAQKEKGARVDLLNKLRQHAERVVKVTNCLS